MKGLYEAHESELLKDRQEPNVEGMDEEQAKEALKRITKREEIMDASPIHVDHCRTYDVQESYGKSFFL